MAKKMFMYQYAFMEVYTDQCRNSFIKKKKKMILQVMLMYNYYRIIKNKRLIYDYPVYEFPVSQQYYIFHHNLYYHGLINHTVSFQATDDNHKGHICAVGQEFDISEITAKYIQHFNRKPTRKVATHSTSYPST